MGRRTTRKEISILSFVCTTRYVVPPQTANKADTKVQRVKNKWKTVFKDGMIHVNGKDYLFAKCNG